jgi:hypothetical protein
VRGLTGKFLGAFPVGTDCLKAEAAGIALAGYTFHLADCTECDRHALKQLNLEFQDLQLFPPFWGPICLGSVYLNSH